MSEDSITYGGYRISAESREVPESATWAIIMTISRGTGTDMESWLFSAGDQFPNKEEGLRYCFEFGKEVIDREMTGGGD
jgi:hypothetical protein